MAFQAPAYPSDLTNAGWQKKKGLIAKLATKTDGTGIGKTLEKLEAAYKKINWSDIDVFKSAPGHAGSRKPEDMTAGVKKAKAQGAAIKGAYDLAREVEIDAKNLAAEWSKSKTIPKSSVAAAENVSKQAKAFSFAIAPGTISAEIDKGVEEEAKVKEIQKKNRLDLIKAVPKAIDDITAQIKSKKVTLETWPTLWKGKVRFVGTQLPTILEINPAVAKEAKDWQVHSNTCKKPKDAKELNSWLDELVDAGARMKPKLKG